MLPAAVGRAQLTPGSIALRGLLPCPESWHHMVMYAIKVPVPGGPEQMEWAQTPTPTPGAGEVLVRTVAAGVNRADLLQRQGLYPPPIGVTPILGRDASGVVEAVGAGVDSWAPGDEVVALLAGGSYAEYFVAPAGQLIRPPKGFDLVSASVLLGVAATVVSNLDRVCLAPGETFLVHGGSGGVGSFAIQYAKTLGARVATTAGTPEKLAYCKELGADILLDYTEDWATALEVATDDHGADVILDIIGAKYLESNVNALADDGRLIIIGMQNGSKGSLDIAQLLNKRGTVTASSIRPRPADQKAAICAQVAERVWPLYESGQIKPPPQIRVPMREARRAHELLEDGQITGKVILVA